MDKTEPHRGSDAGSILRDCYVILLIRGFMSLSSSWLGYRPFKAEARVRAPLETRYLGGINCPHS